MVILQLGLVVSVLGSVAESKEMHLSRSVGESLQLDIPGHVPEFIALFWVFNRTNNVVEYLKKYNDVTPSSGYEDRVEFNTRTYSLTLKNLQKTDSGLYEARASGDQLTVVAGYRLSVWESRYSNLSRLAGDSVQLDIPDHVPESTVFTWVFNRTYNVAEYIKKHKDITITPHYEDRVEFNEGTYSLTLKNLQKTDSGLYEARASGDQVTVVAVYRLSVLGPVSPPAGVSVCVLKTGLYSITLILMLSAVITVHIRARRTRSS